MIRKNYLKHLKQGIKMNKFEEIAELKHIYSEIEIMLIMLENQSVKSTDELYEINKELEEYQNSLIKIEKSLELFYLDLGSEKVMDDLLAAAKLGKAELIKTFNILFKNRNRAKNEYQDK